jgi:ComF family protein
MVYKRLEHADCLKSFVVVPVPIHRSKEQKRGFNQSELIARKLSELCGNCGGLALARVIKTATQVGLSKTQRAANVEGSIICIDRDLINNRSVLLLDDVATTGATLNECAKVLKKCGAKRVDAAVVARD